VRRTVILVTIAAAALAILLRLPFFDAPLTADEGGYAEAARLWDRGATLYRDIWVDRPQGLVLIFRGAEKLGSSSDVLRGVAAATGVLSVLATMLLAFRLTRSRTVAFASPASSSPPSRRSSRCSPSPPTCADGRRRGWSSPGSPLAAP
jgi:hypothetical protein